MIIVTLSADHTVTLIAGTTMQGTIKKQFSQSQNLFLDCLLALSLLFLSQDLRADCMSSVKSIWPLFCALVTHSVLCRPTCASMGHSSWDHKGHWWPHVGHHVYAPGCSFVRTFSSVELVSLTLQPLPPCVDIIFVAVIRLWDRTDFALVFWHHPLRWHLLLTHSAYFNHLLLKN